MDVVVILIYIAAILGIVGALGMIFSAWKFPSLRKTSGVLATWVAIGNLIHNVFAFVGGQNGTFTCTLAAFGRSYGELVSLFVSVIIANVVYNITFSRARNKPMVMKVKYNYYLITWGLSLILAILPLLTNSYGRDSNDKW